MHVAVIQVELAFPGVQSLKEKRHILKPLVHRLRQRFEVAVAEVGGQDAWRTALLGMALVSNHARHARERAQAVVAFLEDQPDARLEDHQVEIL